MNERLSPLFLFFVTSFFGLFNRKLLAQSLTGAEVLPISGSRRVMEFTLIEKWACLRKGTQGPT